MTSKLEKINNILQFIKKEDKVLDVGCVQKKTPF